MAVIDRDWVPSAPTDDDDIPSNRSVETPIGDIVDRRLSRRQTLGGLIGLAGLSLAGVTMTARNALAAGMRSTLTFPEIAHGHDATDHVAKGYKTQVLLRWGDPIMADAPAFHPENQTAEAQLKQFGYNCDYIAFLPLSAGSANTERGLLCVNHEYTNAHLMFPGHRPGNPATRAQVDIEMAAHGHTVVEVARRNGTWGMVEGSAYNRRISALATEMRLSGPAAGHARLKTNADASGRRVVGTVNNCAGGKTPWGTVLIAEENFHLYFAGDPAKTAEARNYKRYGLKGKPRFQWSKYHARFDVEKEPNEPNRFGWMVEYDPYDPQSVPVKRTALGRFKHEGATAVVNRDGRIVVYSGDDQRFDYVYKFVSNGRFNPGDRAANRDLLDSGTLFVAKFSADGSLRWLPLVWGTGKLTPQNGFDSQADVLIETRRAADLLGATPMDRPEDVETNPVTGIVYVMLTNNTKRKRGATDAANPRAKNRHGHVLEMIPPMMGGARDHAGPVFKWEIPILCGDPADPASSAKYHPGIGASGWLSSPDNCAFDPRGRLWIATDGASKAGFADGLWATDTVGPGRALTRHFFRVPRGAELCGPEFTPDGRTLFCSVQHPADERGSTYANPSTRWPDFKQSMPPRPSVLAIVKSDGGPIGG